MTDQHDVAQPALLLESESVRVVRLMELALVLPDVDMVERISKRIEPLGLPHSATMCVSNLAVVLTLLRLDRTSTHSSIARVSARERLIGRSPGAMNSFGGFGNAASRRRSASSAL
eukprot:SAG11_NODE_5823_length_1456_cov_0.831245_3_plen_115_part_01